MGRAVQSADETHAPHATGWNGLLVDFAEHTLGP